MDDTEALDKSLREGLLEAELGLCMHGPIGDMNAFFDHIMADRPEDKWAKDFMENPLRIKFIEGDFREMTQEEFESAFGAEPVWCLNAMAERAENSIGMAYVYDGAKAIVKGQIIRALTLNPKLRGETLVSVATETARYTSSLYENTPETRFQPMIQAIAHAAKEAK